MNRLGRKLIIRIALAIVCIFILTSLLRTLFLPKYYLYQTRQKVNDVTEEIQRMDKATFLQKMDGWYENNNITIVFDTINKSEEKINEGIMAELEKQKVKLNKFWITEDVIAKVKAGERVGVLYSQPKMKSSFLANYVEKDGLIVLAGISIAHLNETLQIIGEFDIYIMLGTLLVLIVIIWLVTKRMTKPLQELKDTSKDIANLSFKTVSIKTNDEIEELATTINDMSMQLKKAHEELVAKNENLKRFASDITHELKTPIALIQAYASGIEDGLDDGTYLQIIKQQTEQVSNLIEYLLHYIKIERDELHVTPVDVVALFSNCLHHYHIQMEKQDLHVHVEVMGEEGKVACDKEKLTIVFHNFISNSIKYTTTKDIYVTFTKEQGHITFTIKNGANIITAEQLEQLWESFYVVEESRSKEMSGTGLGLAIVKTILEQHHFSYGVYFENGEIVFYIEF